MSNPRPVTAVLLAIVLFGAGVLAAPQFGCLLSNLGLGAFPCATSANGGQDEAFKNFLMNNPQVMVDSLDQYRKQQEEEKKAALNEKVKANIERIAQNPNDPVVGNPNGDVTIVEFFDYNCGYCRHAHPEVKKLLEEDKNIRLVHKHLPILGRESVVAARAAFAAKMQGEDKYKKLNEMFLSAGVKLDEAKIWQMAKSAGLNMDKFREDIPKEDITKILEENRNVAMELGINGTPAFVFGDEFFGGALSYEDMKAKVAAIRGGGDTAVPAQAAPEEVTETPEAVTPAPDTAAPAATPDNTPEATPAEEHKPAEHN